MIPNHTSRGFDSLHSRQTDAPADWTELRLRIAMLVGVRIPPGAPPSPRGPRETTLASEARELGSSPNGEATQGRSAILGGRSWLNWKSTALLKR